MLLHQKHRCAAEHCTIIAEKDKAIELAKANIQAFEEANVDYIITNAGGCGAALAEYADLFRGIPIGWRGQKHSQPK